MVANKEDDALMLPKSVHGIPFLPFISQTIHYAITLEQAVLAQ